MNISMIHYYFYGLSVCQLIKINEFRMILCFVDSRWVSLTIDHQLWGNFDIN